MNGNLNRRLTEIQNVLGSNGIITCFSGRFSQGLIEEIGEAVKKHMENEERPKNDIFNVFAIFIEQSQNIKNYIIGKEGSATYQEIVSSSIICIGKREQGYFIWSGNMIENADIAPLQDKLNRVANSNKEELKKLYKEQMKKEPEPGKRGAGLGVIDFARRASQPIEFSFERINETFSFYEIKVIV